MGRRSFSKDSNEYYQNLYKMMSNFSMPHEGDPAVSLDMVAILSDESFSREYYENMFQTMSSCLVAQEGGFAAYDKMMSEE